MTRRAAVKRAVTQRGEAQKSGRETSDHRLSTPKSQPTALESRQNNAGPLPLPQPQNVRSAFPSARQAACAGLRKHYYPDHLRDMVDYDYSDALPESAKQWLAAFTEEYYKGWRLNKETQVMTAAHIREADASRKRRTRGEDVMAFRKHLDEEQGHFRRKSERTGNRPASRDDSKTEGREFAMIAGASGFQTHELRARNHLEDNMVEALDEFRAQLEDAREKVRAAEMKAARLHVPTKEELAATTAEPEVKKKRRAVHS